MGVETQKEVYSDIVVGAFAAAVFVFFRVFECGDVVKVRLDDGSWVLGRIEKIYDGDEKQETLYDIAALDEGYDRRDFFVDPGEFEFPDPPLPFAVGAAVVHLETGRKGRGLFMTLRKALTGQEHGPDMGAILPLIGRERALKRLGG